MISLTSGTHPPHPVPDFVHFLTASKLSQLFTSTAFRISSLVTLSQLQINESSGMEATPPPVPVPSAIFIINDSGLPGRTILLRHVCSSMLYSDASPIRIPPSNSFPSLLTLILL